MLHAMPLPRRGGLLMNLDEAAKEFLEFLGTSKPSVHTIRAYTQDIAAITTIMTSQLGRSPTIEDLTARPLRKAFAVYASTHAKASIARCWSTWNQLSNFLVSDAMIDGNAMASVKVAKVPKSEPHALTDDQSRRLREVVRDGKVPGRKPWVTRDYALIVMLVGTGMRAAECLDLNIASIEGAAGERWVKIHGKGDKTRTVGLDPRIEPLLDAYLRERCGRFNGDTTAGARGDIWAEFDPTTPLWVDDTDTRMTYGKLAYMVRKAFRAAGIDGQREPGALIHALRHAFATALVENGVSAPELQALLGHESLGTTQRYLATRDASLRHAVAANPALRDL